jgi:hypothetical protein
MRHWFSGSDSLPPTECSTWNSGCPVPACSGVPSGLVSWGYAEEGDLLLAVIGEGAFQDQLVPVRGEPQPLHRAAVEVLAAIAVVAAPGAVAAGMHHVRDVGAGVGGFAGLHVQSMARVRVSGALVV